MFGKNLIRKQHLDPSGELWLQEMFATLQGEGPFAGVPSIFIRLAGCNLRCWFCDTDFESGTLHYSPDDALLRLEDLRRGTLIELAVLTGGEPLRQNIVPLTDALLGLGMRVQIETAGTVWVPGLEEFFEAGDIITVVCSPKTPKVHPMIERYCKHYKYIVAFETPVSSAGIPLAQTQVRGSGYLQSLYSPEDQKAEIWLQPCDQQDKELTKRNQDLCIALAMKHGYRLSLQQHKVLGLP